MSQDNKFNWTSLLDSAAPEGARLKSALLTTYDRADENLLVEHLLPQMLRLDRRPCTEERGQQYFLLELDRELKRLRDKFIIISSAMRDEGDAADDSVPLLYSWIWQSIRHLVVGKNRRAVQHAKLWMFHWASPDAGDSEYLELVVSSANLTMSAFKSQLQTAWRLCLPLNSRPTLSNRNSWDQLPAFIDVLGQSTGKPHFLLPFSRLLARVRCPVDVVFIASVPGVHSPAQLKSTPWGSAALASAKPAGRGQVSVSILSPFIGSWSDSGINEWAANFGGNLGTLNLLWIDTAHPWAGNWRMPPSTSAVLNNGSVQALRHLRHLPGTKDECDLLHVDQTEDDIATRWSHAKIYAFSRAANHMLLLTSANFSPSAWGRVRKNGSLEICNFELGVCVPQKGSPFSRLNILKEDIALSDEILSVRSSGITWVDASWNGRQVLVVCRVYGGAEVKGKVSSKSKSVCLSVQTPNAKLLEWMVDWKTMAHPPISIELICGAQMLRVAVSDEREWTEKQISIPDGLDLNRAEQIHDELLLERYGGRIAEQIDSPDGEDQSVVESSPAQPPTKDRMRGQPMRTDQYGVLAFEAARDQFRIVDNWLSQMRRACAKEEDTTEAQALARDGYLLIDVFKRIQVRGQANATGAVLAHEEIELNLKHLKIPRSP